MKKLKFMLLSMAVLAIIGGALAFKARYLQTYCTLTANPVEDGTYTYAPKDATKDCVEITRVKTTNQSPSVPVFYTTKPTNIPCSQLTCSTFTYTTVN